MSDQLGAGLEDEETKSLDGSSLGTSMADFIVNDDIVDEDPDEDRKEEPDESGRSRDLASAPSGVSIFNNLDTLEDQDVDGQGISTLSDYRRIAVNANEAMARGHPFRTVHRYGWICAGGTK